MRLWIKLGIMIALTVGVHLALPTVLRGMADIGDELDYSRALRWGTAEDQVRVLERVALRAGFHSADGPWAEENIRWLAAVREARQALAAAEEQAVDSPPSPNVPSTEAPEWPDDESGVASTAP